MRETGTGQQVAQIHDRYMMMIVFLYQKYHPEDDRITGRNMLVKLL
jgi:hypothetical protein